MRDLVFSCFGSQRGLIFDSVLGTPQGSIFLTMLQETGSLSGGPSRSLWGCILVIFEGPARGSISDQFGVRSGGPFPGPFGGPSGDRFLDLPVDLGEPVGVDFRCLWGSPRDPFWTSIWRSLFPAVWTHFGAPFWERFLTSKTKSAGTRIWGRSRPPFPPRDSPFRG